MLTTKGSYALYTCVCVYICISERIENCVNLFQIHQQHQVPGI